MPALSPRAVQRRSVSRSLAVNASPPTEPPTTRAIRYAVSAGVLTSDRLRERVAYAARHQVDLLPVLAEAERLHLLLVMKALGPAATRAEAIAAVLRQTKAVP